MSSARLIFGPDHEQFRDTARKFFQRELAPRLEAWEERGCGDRDFFLAAGAAGLLCPQAPAEYGGSEADVLYSAIVIEEAAAFSHQGIALSIHSDLVGQTLVRSGSASLIEAMLPRLASGELIAAWAVEEELTARDEGGRTLVDGVVRHVISANLCNLVLVQARDESGELGLFIVEGTAPGLTRHGPLTKAGLKSLDTGDLRFRGVPTAYRIDAKHAAPGRVWQRLIWAVSAVAAAETVLQTTIDYVRERKAFGQALFDFQNTRFVLAHHTSALAVARCFVDACLLDAHRDTLELARAEQAQRWCGNLLGQLSDACVQLHGGYGFMWEFAVTRAYADARALRLWGGGAAAEDTPMASEQAAGIGAEYASEEQAVRGELPPRSLTVPGWFPASGDAGAHLEFRQRLQAFLQESVLPSLPQWEAESGFDRSLFFAAGRAGLLCMTVPTAYGGQGLGRDTSIAVLEEGAAYSNVGLSFSMHSEIITSYLLKFGSESLKQEWLPRMVCGEAVGALGMSEPSAGSDVKALRTTARREGESYILSGSKIFISGGGICDFVIVAAKTNPAAGAKGISLFVVDATLPGFRRGRRLKKLGLKSQNTAELFFDDVRVPARCLLGDENGGFGCLMKELPWERLQIAITSGAGAEAALAGTLEQLHGRRAHGDVMRLQTEVRLGRAYLDHCNRLLLAGTLDTLTATIAKLWITEMHGRVVDGCLELLGPAGFDWANPVGRAWADARAQRIHGGTSEIMKELISREL